MPELPEVELARGELTRWLTGKKLRAVTAIAGTPLRATSPGDLTKLTGHAVRRIERLGKHLLLEFDGPHSLYLHLGMTGKFIWRKSGPEPRFTKLTFGLAKGTVYFCDSRRFGSVRLVPTSELHAIPAVRDLGPDAWEAMPTAAELGNRLTSTRPIKVVLLDQSVLAGIGNIQAAEALWRARIAPSLPANKLMAPQLRALRSAIHASLAFTLKRLQAQAGRDGEVRYVEEGAENPFYVYDREGLPCKRKDRTPIARVTQAARSTFFCPFCQK